MMFDYGTLSDENLSTLLKEGDKLAFTVIYDRYFEALYAHAQSKLDDRDEAKDLIQEIFVNLWNNKENLLVTTSLRSYLFISVRNRILDHFTHQQITNKHISSLQEFIEKGYCITDHLVREKQLIEIIDSQVAQLPEKMRIIFDMSRKDTLTHKEIADKLKISQLTVKKQVSNAVKILRNKLALNFFLVFFIFIYSLLLS